MNDKGFVIPIHFVHDNPITSSLYNIITRLTALAFVRSFIFSSSADFPSLVPSVPFPET